MDAQELKDAARRWIFGRFDEGNFDLIGEMASENWQFHMNGLEPIDVDTFPAVASAFRTAFPDLNNTFEEQVVEGNVVVTRGTTRGTHKAPLGDIPATGKAISVSWVTFTRFENDLIVEDWELYDELSLLRQLGAIPEPV